MYDSSLANLIIILNTATVLKNLFHISLGNFPCSIYQNQTGSGFKQDALLMSIRKDGIEH